MNEQEKIAQLETRITELQTRLDNVVTQFNNMVKYVKSMKPYLDEMKRDIQTRTMEKMKNDSSMNDVMNSFGDLFSGKK